MKKLVQKNIPYFTALIILLSHQLSLSGQDLQISNFGMYKKTFTEIRLASNESKYLWKQSIYAPLLFVNPKTRQVIANDPADGLTFKDGVYIGQLPQNINIANTAIKWGEKTWAMVILPLPDDKFDKLNLIAHELFHKAQPGLGFKKEDPINTHLDKLQGRIYLTLELEALKEALLATDKKMQHTHIINALAFRKYRRSLFPGSDTTENQLELNEGLAEYTGFIVSHRDPKLAVTHFISDIDNFVHNSTFVRSFPFHTIPIYGYILNKKDKTWNREINNKTDLTAFLNSKFGFTNPKQEINLLAKNYGYNDILERESERQDEINKKIAYFKKQFSSPPYLKLTFEKMNVSFNPSNIIPLDSMGTVYPTIRVTDSWGILEVAVAALMSPDWRFIIVTNIEKISDRLISGKGWTLRLNENYALFNDNNTGNYYLKK